MKQKLILAVPILVVLCILWAVIAGLFQQSIKANDGKLIYALDDPYIHMAIAKNFTQYGVWGIDRERFTSSTSSILWPLLIAVVFFFTGPLDSAPLIMNIVFASLATIGIYLFGISHRIPGWLAGFLTLIVVFVAPFPALIFSGMEHILFFGLTLLVTVLASSVLVVKKISKRQMIWLTVGFLLITTTRYEGLFVAIVIAGLFTVQRLFAPAILVGVASAIPIVLYGFGSMLHGWFFVPNPLLLKGRIPQPGSFNQVISSLVELGMERLDQNPFILWLLISAIMFTLIYLAFRREEFSRLAWMNVFFVGILVLHLLFADFGWFYRYEMYLVGLGVLLELTILGKLLVGGWESKTGWKIFLALGTIGAVAWYTRPLFQTRFESLAKTVPATTNIYQQQYQMARFIRLYYPDSFIALNDIGSVSYFTRSHITDLWGLADVDIARLWLTKEFDTYAIDHITRQDKVRISLVYDSWFQDQRSLPPTWVGVGKWTIRNNVVCGDETVSIYAVEPSEVDYLVESLRAFSSQLPEDVIQTGYYRKTNP